MTETQGNAEKLHASAAAWAAQEQASVERAVQEDSWAAERKAAEEQCAVAADVAPAEQARQEQEDLDRAAIVAARWSCCARMPADQRAIEDGLRAVKAMRACAGAEVARDAALDNRAAKRAGTRRGKRAEDAASRPTLRQQRRHLIARIRCAHPPGPARSP
ncbi:hypothetical protein [Streptacidiphilus anmyonensis]|uniref:hypothetical protein n=1 Tax=Streptacidiphilus anmyonensis TaxID=405782 RepID=UPI001364A6B1|nr:hypothetical protein [Streptacidiphilus anmyonensis]